MSPQEFQKLLQAHRRELDALLRARLPVIVGAMAKSHFQAGFRQGGFIDRGLQPWQPAKRQGGSGTAARYGPLLSSRRHLYSSIAYAPAAYRVVITNPVPYAAIHNDGGTLSPTVTDRMRRYAWARYYQAAGAAAAPGHSRGKRGQAAVQRLSEEAERWKRLALTRKQHLTVKLPRRRFVGPSRQLTDNISSRITSEALKILRK